jgi:hypothetical protein
MDCYKDLSPTREALFAIGSVRLPSFLAAALMKHLFSNWRRCRSSLSRVFSAYRTERSNLPHYEINRPKSCRIDRVTGLHA